MQALGRGLSDWNRQDAHAMLTSANRCFATIAKLVEASTRRRNGGTQQVVVKHVQVSDGGRAVIGSVHTTGGMMKGEHKPMHPAPDCWWQGLAIARRSPRCGARTRSGDSCRNPAMANGRCRMHGGKSSGAPRGVGNGNFRHGGYTREAVAERRRIQRLLREARWLLHSIG